MKSLSLHIYRMEEQRTEEIVTIPVKSFNENLIGTIRTIVTDKSEDVFPCTIAFKTNYANMDMMNFEECFPYIIRNGKYEWNVPYGSVTIDEKGLDVIRSHV